MPAFWCDKKSSFSIVEFRGEFWYLNQARVFAIVLSFSAFVIRSVFNPRHTSRHNKEEKSETQSKKQTTPRRSIAIQVSLVLLLSSGLYVDLASHGLYSCALTSSPSPSRVVLPTYWPTAWPGSPARSRLAHNAGAMHTVQHSCCFVDPSVGRSGAGLRFGAPH
jgi:hypothetical protein